MLLRQIKYFICVVNVGSFTKAAEECYISQSAISQQINALENELGVQLITRKNRSFTLTTAGSFFYHKCLVVLDELERIKSQTISIAKNNKRQLRIGYIYQFDIFKLQNTISKFTEIFPDVDITVVTGGHDDLYQLLNNNEIDLSLSDQRRIFSKEANNYKLYSSDCYVEVSSRSPFSTLENVQLNEILKIPCILVSSKEQQENDMDYYQNIMGFGDNYICVSSLEEGHLLVAANKGFMPIDYNANFLKNDELVRQIPLFREDKQLKKDYFAFSRKSNNNIDIENFLNILRQIING